MPKIILTRRRTPSAPFDGVGTNNRVVLTVAKFPANRQRLLHSNTVRTLKDWLSGCYDVQLEVYGSSILGTPTQTIVTRVDNLLD